MSTASTVRRTRAPAPPRRPRAVSARQHAIFEILYHFREASLPVLRKIAFGPYDWTQANAVDVLCRLAAEGIETETIANEIIKDIPNWRYEAILYTINSLAQFAPRAPNVMNSLHEMVKEWASDDPIEAMDILEPLAKHAPDAARKHENLLRGIMREAGEGTRSPLADGQVVELQSDDGQTIVGAAAGPSHPSIPDYHAIRSALILQQLFPADDEVLAKLTDWAENHPEQQVRSELKERLIT